MFAGWLFWLSILVPFYAYAGYPIVLLLLSLVIHRKVHKKPFEPRVSLLIPAYNEARVIEQKIRNSLSLDYPAHKLEIVVACDGSRDNTPELAREFADGVRVRVLDYPVNRGKIAILNASVPELQGEIVVFSDASAMLYPDSVRQLVANFADPEVGAASGRYTVIKATEVAIGKSEDFYWKYETFLKATESSLSSAPGAHGHLHAIRKELYPYPPPGTINDDYVIPVSVLSKGFRCIYDPSAIVYEEAREMTGFGRRVRIMIGNLQQMREIRTLIHPIRPFPLFFFLSHKALRLLVPFAMVTAFAANLWLLTEPFYRAVFFLQIFFYGLAVAGAIWTLRPRLLALPYYFSMINCAVFVGFYQLLTRRRVEWK